MPANILVLRLAPAATAPTALDQMNGADRPEATDRMKERTACLAHHPWPHDNTGRRDRIECGTPGLESYQRDLTNSPQACFEGGYERLCNPHSLRL